jgi:hypothetical protein
MRYDMVMRTPERGSHAQTEIIGKMRKMVLWLIHFTTHLPVAGKAADDRGRSK